MNKQSPWQILLGFVVVVVVGVLLFLFVKGLAESASSLKPEVLGAFVTVIVAVLTVVLGRYYERKKEIEAQLRERKMRIYDTFLGLTMTFLFAETSEQRNTEFVKNLRELIKDMTLWFSADVLREFTQFRRVAILGSSGGATLRQFEKVMYAIRKDLGNSNRNLKADDLLRIFINDLDTMK